MTKVIDYIEDMSIDMRNYHNKIVQYKKGREDITKLGIRESEIEGKIKENDIIVKNSYKDINKYGKTHERTGMQIKNLETKIKNRRLSGNTNKSSAKAHTM